MWATELVLAKEWGCPPWVVHRGPLVWIARWSALKEARESGGTGEKDPEWGEGV